MIRIVVLDSSAESRTRLLDEVTFLLSPAGGDVNLVPRTSVRPLSPQELRYHSAPDICIVGPEIALGEPHEIAKVREIIPSAAVVIRLPDEKPHIALFDQFARLGVDELLAGELGAPEFLRRLLLLSRRSGKKSSGKLIVVDGGKGGLGISTIAAGLAEALYSLGKKTVLVDLDFESQDLSRFMQARPFINENLRLLFDDQRPVTEDSVKECLVPVLSDEDFYLMPPVPESEDLYDSSTQHSRTVLSVLEILDSLADCVVIDMASVRGDLRKTFCRAADKYVFVVNNDPACFYASLDRLSKVRTLLSSSAQLTLLENSVNRHGISDRLLKAEFSRAARLEPGLWAALPLPFCRQGTRWPGSGSTLYSVGSRQAAASFNSLVTELGLTDSGKKAGIFSEVFSKFRPAKRVVKPLLPAGSCPERNLALPLFEKETAKPAEWQPGGRQTDLSDEDIQEFLVSAPQFGGTGAGGSRISN